jgi:multisubunit Na+/H+ antiporter MnhE subunit
LQHRFLQQHFNTASLALSFVTSFFVVAFQHRFYSTIFCNIVSTLPLQHRLLGHHFCFSMAARFKVFGGVEVGTWG